MTQPSKSDIAKIELFTITTWDCMGDRFNGYHIHHYLKKNGHKSYFSVFFKSSHNNDVECIGNPLLRVFDRSFTLVLEKITGLRSFLSISGYSLLWNSNFRKANVIHLQLVHGFSFFSLFLIPLISHKRRMIWTIHDPWIMTGHCTHPMECEKWKNGCGRCHDLAIPMAILWDSTVLSWRLKRWVMKKADITLIVASSWMKEHVQQSQILSHLPCYLIPFGIDVEKFKPKDKENCRKKFNIPPDSYVIAFRFRGKNDPFKGWPYIRDALNNISLTKPIYVLVIDKKGATQFLNPNLNCIEIGYSDDQETLIDALNAADIFLMPSVVEAFGMMAIESMACGTPVIVFEGTSLPDVIHAPYGGVTVPYKDTNALTHAIEELLRDKKRYDQIVRNGLQIVQKEYNMENYLNNHIDLYSNLINSPL